MLAVQAMQAQNMMWAPAFATAISSVANVGINVLLIRWYGFEGAAAAFSVTRVLLFLLLAGKQPSFVLCQRGCHLVAETCCVSYCAA
jgi:O-antigen/teichoic acid export membrane protein